jgi:hypothetical protein
METNTFEEEMDNRSLIYFLDELNSTLPESIFGGDKNSAIENKNSPIGLLQSGEHELAESSEMENKFFESERKGNPPFSSLKKELVKPTDSKKGAPDEQDTSFMNSFLIELVHSIKNNISSIYHATVLKMDKYDDIEIRNRSHAQVKEDIKKIDSVLNSILNFINITTPLLKTNTLFTILEEVLEANEKQLLQKNIKTIKRYEKDLPETFIHPEQVRFILYSLLQYVILSTPSNSIIGLLMKSCDLHDGTVAKNPSPQNNRRYIEVTIGFNEDRNPINQTELLSDPQRDQRNEIIYFILKLVKDILQRNHGMMIENHGKRLENLITVRFPVERRRVVYYAPIAL